MPRTLSDEFHRRAHSVENVDYAVNLLEIDHSELAEPIRLCDDNSDIVSNGSTYTAIAIDIQLPNDSDNSSNVNAKLSIDNIGKELVAWLETTGGGRGATAALSVILRSDPDNIEITYPLDVANINITQTKVTADLIFTDLINQSAVGMFYRPENTPGLY